MSKSKGKGDAKTSPLQVVGVVYNHNKDDRSLRLIDFLKAGRDFADRISAKAEEEEAERLKAENDQRVEELLAKAKDIKQRSRCESENQNDTTAVYQSESTGNLKQKSQSRVEENGNVENKNEKPHSKADALERLRKMEWKRCQEDHRNISSNLSSKDGRPEFPPLTKSKKDEEYFSGTKVEKKNRERKKNREEKVVSLEELKKYSSTVPISEKNSKLAHTMPPPSNSCWQNKAGAALFERAKIGTEQDVEDVELTRALSESLKEQQEQQKRFLEILGGSSVETNRKPSGIMAFPPPEPDKEEDWDGDESDYIDAEDRIEDNITEDKYQVEIKGKQGNKGSESKGAGNAVSKNCTTSVINDKSLDLYDNGEQRNVNGVSHFNGAQQCMNKLATDLSEKLKQEEVQRSDVNRSYAPLYHIRKEQTHFDRTLLQHDDLKNKGIYEDESRLPQRVSESLKSKSNAVNRQDGVINFERNTTHHKFLNHGNRSHVYKNIHDIPTASSTTRKDDDLSPKVLPLADQKHFSQSGIDISQSFPMLHIKTEPEKGWEERKLTHQNSTVANAPSVSDESIVFSLSSDNLPDLQAKTQESGTKNMQHLTQAREQQSQQLCSVAVPESVCPPFSAQGINAAAEQYQQNQPLPSQSVPGQSASPDTYASLLEELQRIRMYQNYLMQLSAQESLQMAMQQQLQSMNAVGTAGSTLTQEQLQKMLQVQHQHSLMPDIKALLHQNAPIYAPVANILQPQYPSATHPNSRDTLEHSQTPSSSPGSLGNATMVQKHYQEILQQQQQQHPSALLHTGFPGAGITDKDLTQQQWGGMAQSGTQASTTVHLSLQTSYPNTQNVFVGPAQHPQPMVLQQQYVPNMHAAKPPSPQSLTAAPSNFNPTAINAAMSAVEATHHPQSMLLQQYYAPNVHAAKPPSTQRLTAAPPNMCPTATNAAMSTVEATCHSQSMLLQQQYLANILGIPQSFTGASSNINPPATNIAISAMEATQCDRRAQLMTAAMYNQHSAQHTMAGLVPLVSQEKPKSKGRGRLLH